LLASTGFDVGGCRQISAEVVETVRLPPDRTASARSRLGDEELMITLTANSAMKVMIYCVSAGKDQVRRDEESQHRTSRKAVRIAGFAETQCRHHNHRGYITMLAGARNGRTSIPTKVAMTPVPTANARGWVFRDDETGFSMAGSSYYMHVNCP
jgi:hypothetical protein